MKIIDYRKGQELTTKEAVEKCSANTSELLANLLDHLMRRGLINKNQLSEIFEWDFSVED